MRNTIIGFLLATFLVVFFPLVILVAIVIGLAVIWNYSYELLTY